jgi:hypothetical protein
MKRSYLVVVLSLIGVAMDVGAHAGSAYASGASPRHRRLVDVQPKASVPIRFRRPELSIRLERAP